MTYLKPYQGWWRQFCDFPLRITSWLTGEHPQPKTAGDIIRYTCRFCGHKRDDLLVYCTGWKK